MAKQTNNPKTNTKTIYVKPEDARLFKELEKVTETSLSCAIVTAIKFFLENKEEFKRHTILATNNKERKLFSFFGKRIMQEIDFVPKKYPDDPADRWTLYATKGGKYLVHWESTDAWKHCSEPYGYLDLHQYFGPSSSHVHDSDYAIVKKISSEFVGSFSGKKKEFPKYWQDYFERERQHIEQPEHSHGEEFLDI